jgi:hypothetical protein
VGELLSHPAEKLCIPCRGETGGAGEAGRCHVAIQRSRRSNSVDRVRSLTTISTIKTNIGG